MKYLRLLLMVFLVIGLASTASAQKQPIDKGSFNVGGGFSLSTASGDLYGDDSVTSITLTPGVRYFVIDNLAVGVDLLLQTESAGGDSDTTIGIGPVAAFFFRTKSDKIYPFIGAGFAYASNSQSWRTHSTTGFQIRFGGGAAFMLKPNLAVIAELIYAIESMAYGSHPSEGGGRLMFSIGLGAFIY